MKQKLLLVIIISFLIDIGSICASDRRFEAVMLPEQIYDPVCNQSGGIIGTIQTGGRIDIKVFEKSTNTLLYHVYTTTTTTDYQGSGTVYNKSELGSGAEYYPNVWDSRFVNQSFASFDRKRYDKVTEYPYKYIRNPLDVYITFSENNATLTQCKIPGIGVVDKFGGNALFEPNHFCHDLKNINTFQTKAWTALKSPNINQNSDLAIAAHRGVWGDNLGKGNPENSTAAIAATKEFTDILETDIMITHDKKLIVSHDYNLHRLTDYSGSDRDYLFNMNSSDLTELHLRRRNMTVSDFKFLTFDNLVDELLKNKLVMTIDIKDIRSRYKDGVCVDNCEYDPKTAGEEAKIKIEKSWMEILKGCITIAMKKNATSYIAFKVPHTFSKLNEYIHKDTLSQVLFMPVIQPNRKDFLEFTDSWISDGGKTTVAYETNFKLHNDIYLQPISRQGKTYENFLHYVYANTGLRPGCYPEEQMGPKGIVNRWADWLIKDLRYDVRGDHYFLMTIPYGRIMILTTDRPDIWRGLNDMYNKGGL